MHLGKHSVVCPKCAAVLSPTVIRFMSHVSIQENGCWNWTGGKHSKGKLSYGKFRDETGVQRFAHRVSYRLFKGPVPDDMDVLHKCVANRSCVNPDHLYLGTAKENIRDAIAQGRKALFMGMRSHFAKLSDADIKIIRASESLTATQLADMFNVGPKTIQRIRTGKTWYHI